MFTTDALAAALSGRYTLDRLVGEGGMAKVFLARDLRHNRQVALKVLRPDLGAVVGVERFQAEIEVTANLQHPNLLPLFDSGFAGDLLYYVMPYVEGESLRARLDREKQLPVDEAVRLSSAIASALDYAHRKGVIHRDLKPENILLNEGQPLVADFGIALAISNAGGARITQTGLSLGTPQYMSPEQATGDRAIDARTDIYALGALTYEMLTGEPPHTGSTAQAIIARVLTETPRPLRASRPSVPVHVEATVARAMEKIPADRFESAKGFADALTNPSMLVRSVTHAQVAGAAPRSRLRDPVVLGMGALALGAIGLAAFAMARRSRTADDSAAIAMTFQLEPPDNGQFFRASGNPYAIDPAGTQIAYVGSDSSGANKQLYLRRLDDPIARPLPGTGDAGSPTFSVDGRSIAFLRRASGAEGPAFIVPTNGGTPRQLSSTPLRFITMGDGDVIVGADRNTIYEFSKDGGTQRVLFRADGTNRVASIARTELLPGSEWLLLTYWRGEFRSTDSARIAVVSLKTGALEDVGIAGGAAQYAEPGYLLFARNVDELYAVPFSVSSRRTSGQPVLLLRDVDVSFNNASALFSVSQNGTLVYQRGVSGERGRDGRPLTMVAVDRKGSEKMLTHDTANYESPRISPDGRHIAVTIGGSGANGAGSTGTWIVDVATGGKTRLSVDSNSFRGMWSRDGTTVYYRQQLSTSALLWARPWDASAPPRIVAHGNAEMLQDLSFGPPHGLAAIRHKTAGANADLKTQIVLAPIDSIDAPRPLFTDVATIVNPRVSPDGKLLCYASNESGKSQIYVTPIPGPGPHVLVSVDGGEEPTWSWDGNTIYYRTPNPNRRMIAAIIAQRPTLEAVKRDTLFADIYARQRTYSAYDVFPDGRFLMTKLADQAISETKVYVTQHWPKLLERLTAGERK